MKRLLGLAFLCCLLATSPVAYGAVQADSGSADQTSLEEFWTSGWGWVWAQLSVLVGGSEEEPPPPPPEPLDPSTLSGEESDGGGEEEKTPSIDPNS